MALVRATPQFLVGTGGVPELGFEFGGSKVPLVMSRTIAQCNIPFLIMPGDGAANGCQFTGTNGAFTLSAAIIANIGTSLAWCYAYFSANFGGSSLPAGWYWTEFSSDTAGIVYAENYTSGKAIRPATETAITTNLSGWVTATTIEVVGPSGFVLPGGALGKNGYVEFFLGCAGSAAGTKTFIAKAGGVSAVINSLTSSPTSNTLGSMACMDSMTAKMAGRTIASSSSSFATTTTFSLDTSVDQEISFSLQQSTNVATPVLLRAYAVATYGE